MKHRRGEAEAEMPLFIGGHLSALCIPFITGLALGLVFLLALRFERLRWTWALLGAPLAYLLWLLDWQVGLCFTTAITTAAGGGLYWHIEDTKRGGEEARAARESIGPFHAARAWAAQRRVGKQRVEPARKSVLGRNQDDRLALGRTHKGSVCHVPLGLSRGVHSFVIGATGAGKTVTQAAIAQAHILSGLSVIVIDPKGDRYLHRVLQTAASHMGVRFRHWSPTTRATYNPFARGGPTEITDKALAGHRWSEPHYELATQRLLLHVLTTMQAAGQWPPTLSGIVRHMDPDRLDLLAQGVGGDLAARVSEYVDGLSARGRSDLGGGRDRLAVLADGELGPLLDPALGDGPQIDLAEALRQREVVYFHIDADRFPAASKLLGAALVIDLVTLTADMQKSPDVGGLLVIDEFAALAAEQVSRLFGRARSAGLSVALGTQSLADLRGARPDDDSDTLTEQVLTNIEFAVVHREADPDSAERLARMAGTQPAWSTTEKIGGRRDPLVPREGTRTRSREFVVLPDEIKRLGVGEAVLVNPTAKTPGQIVRIFAPAELGSLQ